MVARQLCHTIVCVPLMMMTMMVRTMMMITFSPPSVNKTMGHFVLCINIPNISILVPNGIDLN